MTRATNEIYTISITPKMRLSPRASSASTPPSNTPLTTASSKNSGSIIRVGGGLRPPSEPPPEKDCAGEAGARSGTAVQARFLNAARTVGRVDSGAAVGGQLGEPLPSVRGPQGCDSGERVTQPAAPRYPRREA